MKKFVIRDGFSFVLPNNEVLTGGDTIDLPDDIAALHAHKLEEVVKKAKAPKKAPDGGGSDGATGNTGGAQEGGDDTGASGDTGAANNDASPGTDAEQPAT
ncbi:hypothetical protein ACO0LG_22635 [Undibacterium sp. Ji42W]|uniref:hypothetical protein n=1 Tax=Undibacterium sp. Ji42W TaxID=3413039 RepID=UPI003BF0B15F